MLNIQTGFKIIYVYGGYDKFESFISIWKANLDRPVLIQAHHKTNYQFKRIHSSLDNMAQAFPSNADEPESHVVSSDTLTTRWFNLAREGQITIDPANRPDDLDDVYVLPEILATPVGKSKDQEAQVVYRRCLSSSTMVNHLAENFAQRAVDPLIGRKLVIILMWTTLPFKQRMPGVDSHANLLLIDYRADEPPYDVYIFEPNRIEDAEKKVAPKVIKAMLDYAKKNGKISVLCPQYKSKQDGTVKNTKGKFVYGHQQSSGTDCFGQVVQVVRGILHRGANSGLQWFLDSNSVRDIVRWT